MEARARIIGYLQGDGHVTKDYARFYTKESYIAELFTKDLKAAYGIEPYERLTKSGKTKRKNIIEVGTGIKAVLVDLHSTAIFGSEWMPPVLGTVEERKAYLQALFDSGGTVSCSRKFSCPRKYKTRKVHLFSKNLPAMQKIREMLAQLGIKSNICGPIKGYLYQLLISGHNNLVLFARQVGFRNPRKMNKLTRMLSSYRQHSNPSRLHL